MKKTLLFVVTILVFVSAYALADRVTINGTTYECSNHCSVNLGPPATVQDCCGGTVAELRRDAIIIDVGP